MELQPIFLEYDVKEFGIMNESFLAQKLQKSLSENTEKASAIITVYLLLQPVITNWEETA